MRVFPVVLERSPVGRTDLPVILPVFSFVRKAYARGRMAFPVVREVSAVVRKANPVVRKASAFIPMVFPVVPQTISAIRCPFPKVKKRRILKMSFERRGGSY